MAEIRRDGLWAARSGRDQTGIADLLFLYPSREEAAAALVPAG